ncbi:hypothetical protein LZ31DRAFT_226113 [Colletotrichum somersetense]|nr:hypothetical protein LZ31DRAFT_226113 [Colletotrichum somersetense]
MAKTGGKWFRPDGTGSYLFLREGYSCHISSMIGLSHHCMMAESTSAPLSNSLSTACCVPTASEIRGLGSTHAPIAIGWEYYTAPAHTCWLTLGCCSYVVSARGGGLPFARCGRQSLPITLCAPEPLCSTARPPALANPYGFRAELPDRGRDNLASIVRGSRWSTSQRYTVNLGRLEANA